MVTGFPEYIETSRGVDWLVEEGLLPLYMEDQLRQNLLFAKFARSVPSTKEGKFDMLLSQPSYAEFASLQTNTEEAETSDFEEFRDVGTNWSTGETKELRRQYSYSLLLRQNDTAGRIPQALANMCSYIGNIINKNIIDTIRTGVQGNAGTVTPADWSNNPIQVLNRLKTTAHYNDMRYNYDTIFLSNEAFDIFGDKIFDPDYHMAFSNRQYGRGDSILTDSDGTTLPVQPIATGFTKDQMGGIDYILFDSSKEFIRWYSNTNAYQMLGREVYAPSEDGQVQIGLSWEEQQSNNATAYRTYLLVNGAPGLVRTRSAAVGTLTA